MATLRFRAPEAERLDRALAGRPEVGSRALAERLIGSGAVLVEGRPRAKSHRLEGGEDILVELPPDAPPPVAEEMDLTVVWEDEHLLVVEKPPGVVHPGAGQLTGTLVSGLLALDAAGGDEERPGIVHRLDRDTSGLLVVARSEEAHARLQELIRRHAVERRYLALVLGTPRSRTGRIEAAIGRDRVDRTCHSLDTATPREAVTRFEVVERLGPRAARARARDGPDAPDPRPPGGDRAAGLRRPVYGVAGDLGLERQFLHAAGLAFDHPFTGERVAVTSPLPDDLAAALEGARNLA